MRRLRCAAAIAVALVTLASRPAHAAEEAAGGDRPKAHTLAFDAGVAYGVQPLDLGVGADLRYRQRLSTRLAWTARFGVLVFPDHIRTTDTERYRSSSVEAPLLAGIEVFLLSDYLYLTVEGGLSYVSRNYTEPVGESTQATSGVAPALAVGLGSTLGPIDVRAGAYTAWPMTAAQEGAAALLFTAGFHFADF